MLGLDKIKYISWGEHKDEYPNVTLIAIETTDGEMVDIEISSLGVVHYVLYENEELGIREWEKIITEQVPAQVKVNCFFLCNYLEKEGIMENELWHSGFCLVGKIEHP